MRLPAALSRWQPHGPAWGGPALGPQNSTVGIGTIRWRPRNGCFRVLARRWASPSLSVGAGADPADRGLHQSASHGFEAFWSAATSPRLLASCKLSFGASLIAALINLVFGLVIAWCLVRYEFPGRKIVDALIDLPFALPTAVAGIALTALCAPNGWVGAIAERFGIKLAFSPLGVLIALIFIGLPFIVRTVQPVLEDLDTELEEAASALLGPAASRPCATWCCPP